MRIGIYLNKKDRDKCDWFDRKYIEIWKSIREHILKFRKDAYDFYVTSGGITFELKDKVLKVDQDSLICELASIATIYFNEDLSQKIHLRANKLSNEYIIWDQIKACIVCCDAIFKYNIKHKSNNNQISLLDIDAEIPDFAMYGEFFEEEENIWKSGGEY